ncbi:hypothetical protein KIL84_022994 [Mauremys mutica]|uniref:Uncharacterized protein n=1 Tax=Mauremys mutica TaxID=74926 RepID=A0A9D4ARC3_9SAUR|nr:hypothetical protein KIL84_022994 [Mauremys mutica]
MTLAQSHRASPELLGSFYFLLSLHLQHKLKCQPSSSLSSHPSPTGSSWAAPRSLSVPWKGEAQRPNAVAARQGTSRRPLGRWSRTRLQKCGVYLGTAPPSLYLLLPLYAQRRKLPWLKSLLR